MGIPVLRGSGLEGFYCTISQQQHWRLIIFKSTIFRLSRETKINNTVWSELRKDKYYAKQRTLVSVLFIIRRGWFNEKLLPFKLF